MDIQKMQIETIPVEQINPATYNPRKDLRPGDPEYEKLKRSLGEFGLVEPLVWNRHTGNLVGGHQRFKILMESNPVELEVSVVDLNTHQEKTLNIVLNKVQGGWDDEKLAALIEELAAAGADLELTGFEQGELNRLLADFRPSEEDEIGDFENNEITLGSFDEENFEVECPRCHFHFNPKEPVEGEEA